jgi:hypothetical protein
MMLWLRRLWTMGCITGIISAVIWFSIDHRTPPQRAEAKAKETALFAEWDRQLIEQIEKQCGEISAKTIVMDGAYGCVEAVMNDWGNPSKSQ